MSWHVYILRCADGTLYTGVTNDPMKRLAAHNAGLGAKYTRGRGPIVLIWKKRMADKGAALKREAAIKRMTRAEKEALLSAGGGSALGGKKRTAVRRK